MDATVQIWGLWALASMLSIDRDARANMGKIGVVEQVIGAIARNQHADDLVAAGIAVLTALAREYDNSQAILQENGHTIAAEATKHFPGNAGLVKKLRELNRAVKAAVELGPTTARSGGSGEGGGCTETAQAGVSKVRRATAAVQSLKAAKKYNAPLRPSSRGSDSKGLTSSSAEPESQKSAISMYKPSLTGRRLNIVG